MRDGFEIKMKKSHKKKKKPSKSILRKHGSFVRVPHTGRGHISDAGCFPQIPLKKARER